MVKGGANSTSTGFRFLQGTKAEPGGSKDGHAGHHTHTCSSPTPQQVSIWPMGLGDTLLLLEILAGPQECPTLHQGGK